MQKIWGDYILFAKKLSKNFAPPHLMQKNQGNYAYFQKFLLNFYSLTYTQWERSFVKWFLKVL